MTTRWPAFILVLLTVVLFDTATAHADCTTPAGVAGQVKFDEDLQVMKFCDDTNWRQIGPFPLEPVGCPNVGDTCVDGSIYAGLSPDGNVRMYTTPSDSGIYGNLAWDDGDNNRNVDVGVTNRITGEANTATIVATDADSDLSGFQYHGVAKHCYDLAVHGHDDWYLPAMDELTVLYNNRDQIGGFTQSSTGHYWSSNDNGIWNAGLISFNGGGENWWAKNNEGRRARCVRKETQLTSIVPNGLIGHWRLDETSGTTAFDSSGSGYDLTMYGGLTGSDSQSGRIVKAIAFDGVDDYMRAGGMDIDLGSSFTVSFWLKRSTNNGQNNRHIVDFRNASGTSTVVAFRAGNSDIQVRDTSGSPFSFIPMTYPTDGDWHYYALTYDGATVRSYLDGREYAAGTISLTANDINRIDFSNCCTTPSYFEGHLDDVRLYNRALSADEVKYLAESFDANVTYDADARVPKYFNGENWVAMGESKYAPNAVEFDGTNDYLSVNGATAFSDNSKHLTGSFWIKRKKNHDIMAHKAGSEGIYIRRNNSASYLHIRARDASLVQILDIKSSNNSFPSDSWLHVLFSVDMSDPAKRHIYINDISELATVNAYVDGIIDLTGSTFYLGSRDSLSGNFIDMEMVDFWMDAGTYIDLSVEANRRKFIDEHGQPVYLGADGSLPTGSAPDIFLSGATDSWHTNKGTGGGFTENGALEDAGSAPGDMFGNGPTDGLIGWWKLDETSGTGIIDYASGYDGTVQGNLDPSSNSVGGVFGRALHFDGSNSYITLPDLGVDTNTVSFTAWVRAERLPRDMGVIIDRDPAPSDSEGIFIKGGNLMPTWDNKFPNSGISVPGSEWTLLAVTVSPTEQKGYVVSSSGGFQSYTNSGTFSADTLDTLEIGRDTILMSRNFDGAIDDVRIYNRELSAAEVQSLYDAARCTNPDRFAGTMVYNADHNVLQYCDATLPGNGWQATMP